MVRPNWKKTGSPGFPDVLERRERILIPENVKYTDDERFTLNWLANPDLYLHSILPNNTDATFKKYNRKPRPSCLLLHYNYGAAAVKWWGHGQKMLQKHASLPRLSMHVPAAMGPSKVRHERVHTIQKLNDAWAGHRPNPGNSKARAVVEMADSEGQTYWEEDDLMLFFWGTRTLPKIAIGRRWRKILSVWSSGGKMCLRI